MIIRCFYNVITLILVLGWNLKSHREQASNHISRDSILTMVMDTRQSWEQTWTLYLGNIHTMLYPLHIFCIRDICKSQIEYTKLKVKWHLGILVRENWVKINCNFIVWTRGESTKVMQIQIQQWDYCILRKVKIIPYNMWYINRPKYEIRCKLTDPVMRF